MFNMLKICPVYVSKHNSNRQKQVILLMIPTEKDCIIFSKKLSELLRGLTSKNDGDFHCLNCLHCFRTKNKLESHKKICENKDFVTL